jgi:2'-5' RNA ligase
LDFVVYAFASFLDGAHAGNVAALRRELEDRCAYRGIPGSIPPHFTWQAAESYDWPVFMAAVQRIAARHLVFPIQTAGVGMFTGENPQIYLSIVRTRHLDGIHQLLWDKILPCSLGANLDYAPSAWVPHISLVAAGISPANLACGLELLIRREFSWEISVDNFVLLENPWESTAGIRERWSLSPETSADAGTII